MSLPREEIDKVLVLENQICFPFYAASRLIIQTYTPFLEKMGITYPQYLVLMVLWEKDGRSVKEIGEELFLDSGTLSPIMQKLVSNGLIVRSRSTEDDRVVLNKLTPKSQKLKAGAAEMNYSLFCRSGLSLDEAETLRSTARHLLTKLIKIRNEDIDDLSKPNQAGSTQAGHPAC